MSALSGLSKFLTSRQLADELGISDDTLSVWRCHGRGPKFLRIGGNAVRYKREDVDAWVESNTLAKNPDAQKAG